MHPLTPTSSSTKQPVPTSTSSPSQSPTALNCWNEGGRIEEGSFRTDLLPLPLEHSLYLPPCYDQFVDQQYPILYIIHGQNYDHKQWINLGIDKAADELIVNGEISPLIIVFPRDRNWDQPTEDNFGVVLVEGLLPWVDDNYRTLSTREYRAIGGLSRGAGWAVHLGLRHWEKFGSIGAHSLPIFWSDTRHIRGWLDTIPEDMLPRIFLDIGENDRPQILESALWFENVLTEKNIPHEWYLNPGYHEEKYWQNHIEEYLRWYTSEW